MTDGALVYRQLAALPQGYTHYAVNHQQNFVAPPVPGAPPIHTQTIEATWNSLKHHLRNMRGTSEAMWKLYLYQYMWQKAHQGENIFGSLWFSISIQYPV